MSKPSILRKLADADLEAVHHMIRRDAMSDDAIATEASARLGAGAKINGMVIFRYRQSAQFKRWLQAWENQDVELRKSIATQKQRFEFISSLVKDTDSTGIETVSNGLLARLLTLATEMSDAELVEAAAGKRGWISRIISVVNDQARRERNAAGQQAATVARDGEISIEEREQRIKEIFGIK